MTLDWPLVADLKHIYAGNLLSNARFQIYVESLGFSEDILNDRNKLAKAFSGEKTEANPAVRVLLVGPGGAGKTLLFELLTKPEVSNDSGGGQPS